MNIENYISDFQNLLLRIKSSEIDYGIKLIEQALMKNNSIFILGNGGSHSNSEHFSCDLTRIANKLNSKSQILCLSSNTSKLTAYSNDYSFQNYPLSEISRVSYPDDLLIVFSVSGTSENIVKFVEAIGVKNILCFTGESGIYKKGVNITEIKVDSLEFGIVEAVHNFLFHYIIEVFESSTSNHIYNKYSVKC